MASVLVVWRCGERLLILRGHSFNHGLPAYEDSRRRMPDFLRLSELCPSEPCEECGEGEMCRRRGTYGVSGMIHPKIVLLPTYMYYMSR